MNLNSKRRRLAVCGSLLMVVASIPQCGRSATIVGSPVTMASLLTNPSQTIAAGGLQFSNFRYGRIGDFPLSSGVTVVPILEDNGDYGLRIAGPFRDSGGGAFSDAIIKYDVAVNDSNHVIAGATLSADPSVGPQAFFAADLSFVGQSETGGVYASRVGAGLSHENTDDILFTTANPSLAATLDLFASAPARSRSEIAYADQLYKIEYASHQTPALLNTSPIYYVGDQSTAKDNNGAGSYHDGNNWLNYLSPGGIIGGSDPVRNEDANDTTYGAHDVIGNGSAYFDIATDHRPNNVGNPPPDPVFYGNPAHVYFGDFYDHRTVSADKTVLGGMALPDNVLVLSGDYTFDLGSNYDGEPGGIATSLFLIRGSRSPLQPTALRVVGDGMIYANTLWIGGEGFDALMAIGAGASMTTYRASVQGNGSIAIQSGGELTTDFLDAKEEIAVSGRLVVNKTLTMSPEASLAIAHDATVIVGELSGAPTSGVLTVGHFGQLVGGDVRGNVRISEGGSASPGSDSGALTVNGNYTQHALATLSVKIAGTEGGVDYGRLEVSETAVLGGVLEIALLNNFSPSPGDVFEIITASAVSNAFDSLKLPDLPDVFRWQIAYASDSVELATRFASDFNLDGLVDVGDLHVWQAAQGVNELGDADGDGDSDLDDFEMWQRQNGSLESATNLFGDLNFNLSVNASDLAQWQGDYGVNDYSDANRDGATDGSDFLIWQRGFGASLVRANLVIPEPSAAILTLLFMGIGIAHRQLRFRRELAC